MFDTSEFGEVPNIDEVGGRFGAASVVLVPSDGGVNGDKDAFAFWVAAFCLASAASFRAAAAACRSSSVLLTLLAGVVKLPSESEALDEELVTSDVPKNVENASVTGSCGFALFDMPLVASNFKFFGV